MPGISMLGSPNPKPGRPKEGSPPITPKPNNIPSITPNSPQQPNKPQQGVPQHLDGL